ncbi:MAG: NnrS family protein [Myxococcota bacterium]
MTKRRNQATHSLSHTLKTIRHEPYRIFFPIGIILSWAGVGHWFLLGIEITESYRPIFHAMTQIQGFLTAFAFGFLFTMIPRRTRSAEPGCLLLGIGLAGPIGCTFFAWHSNWVIAQCFWLLSATSVLVFVLRRLVGKASGRRPPNAFIWLPIAIVTGIVGSILAGVGGILGEHYWSVHQLGRDMILQGMFTGLVVGVGALALPMMTRGEPPSDATQSTRDRLIKAAHGLAAVTLVGTFWIENVASLRVGLLTRALLIALVLIPTAKLWRPPSKPGLNKWLLWISAWCLPLGYFLAGLFVNIYKAGLHVSFIGGFALLALSVGSQVVLGHGGFEGLQKGRPWPVILFGGALLSALIPRTMMELQPDALLLWISIAAGCFLLGTLTWFTFLVPKIIFPSHPNAPP